MTLMSELIIDPVAFNEAKAMMQHKFEKVLGYFFEDTQSYIDTIQKGIEQQDASLIAPAAHTIKSSSRQLGAIRLSEVSALLEQKAKDYIREPFDFSGIRILSDEIKELFQSTKTQMEKQQ